MNTSNLPIEDVARYIGLSLTTKGLSVSPLKLQKILYYVQAWFMALFGRENTVFVDVPQAWVNGPVYPKIYHAYKDKTISMCDHLTGADFFDGEPMEGLRIYAEKLELDAERSELLESVIMLYGKQTQNQLIWMTHSERPWAEARGAMAPYERSETPISLDLMCSYYKERYDKNHSEG